MTDHDDHRDPLMTDDEVRDELGSRVYDEAVASGELRRVHYGEGEFVLRGDVERIRAENDPGKLAARVPRW